MIFLKDKKIKSIKKNKKEKKIKEKREGISLSLSLSLSFSLAPTLCYSPLPLEAIHLKNFKNSFKEPYIDFGLHYMIRLSFLYALSF